MLTTPQILAWPGEPVKWTTPLREMFGIEVSVAGELEDENILKIKCGIVYDAVVAGNADGQEVQGQRIDVQVKAVAGKPIILGGMRTSEGFQYCVLTVSYPEKIEEL